ncbi:MAG: glutamyl-tRNA reductase [Bacteroidales bacterium]|jgi:glutamyl-tRNA reductase
MHFIVVGINFKTAKVDVREKFHFVNESLPEALGILNSYSSVKGSVILSTCNRVEIYASVNNIENGFADIIDFISKFHEIPVEQVLQYIIKKNCQSAITHLFRVIASLESMVIGEYQIQGQVKSAYFTAKENNSTNSMLNKLFQTAIQIGKKVRSETKIGEGSVSVATLAVEMVKQIFEYKNNLNILLIGAGKISTLTALNFQQQFKNCNITVTNRSDINSLELAQKFNSKVIEYGKRFESIIDNDIIIASTSAPNFIVCKHELLMMKDELKDKTRIFIDLSIPRNIDPEINSIENCFVYSIDNINKIIDSTIDKRTIEISKAEKIINDISEDYYEWYAKQFIVPTMIEIKKELIVLKQNTLSSYETFLNNLDEEQKDNINEILDSYSDKIIKVIMLNFRKANSKEDLIEITKTLKNTFTLETNEQEQKIHCCHTS